MITRGLFDKLRRLRIIVVLMALLLAYGAISYSPQASTPLLDSVELGGVTGSANNTALAYGRFVLVTPFWPSMGIAENGDLDLGQLDNHSLYVVDTTKPDALAQAKLLAPRDARQTVYFPSRVRLDGPSSAVYVRGTRFEEKDGEVTPIDVIAYVKVNLDDNGKPVWDSNVVPIDIQGVTGPYTSEAPLDFALSGKGDLLVFTNGASIFSFNLAEGYVAKADIVPADQYGPSDRVTFLNVDAATNIVSVCESRKYIGKGKIERTLSEISFFKLESDGMFTPLKRVSSDQFPLGTSLTEGSNIVIVSESDSEYAAFVTSDGSLYQVDLREAGEVGTAKLLYSFPELAQTSGSATPIQLQYDAGNRTLGIVEQGFTAQISRPANGKPGRISRPANLYIASGTPVLAMAKLSKKNKVTSARSFISEFSDEGGLSNFVIANNSQWLVSTYSGKLFSVGIGADLSESTLQFVGSLGSRVDRIDYYADRSSVVAISAFTLNEDGLQMSAPGSLVVGRLTEEGTQFEGAILQTLLPTASTLGRGTVSIRRPCNIRR